MLVYRDTKARSRLTPPPWVDGAADLMQREDSTGVRYWGIGNAHLLGDRKDWHDLDDGWQVSVAADIDPQQFRRTMRWCRTVDVEDTSERLWTAPVILGESGDRVILVSYGKDFLPVLSSAQTRAVEIAKAARDMLTTARALELALAERIERGEVIPESEEAPGLDMPVAARWTSELLSLTHHISMEVIATLGVLDDALIVDVLSAAVGLNLKRLED